MRNIGRRRVQEHKRRGTWHSANASLGDVNIRALAIDPAAPAILYAGTGGGVFKSTNGGEEWSQSNDGLTIPEILGPGD